MRIGYYIRNYVVKGFDGKPAISGGVKVISQHVKILNEAGIETLLITRKVQTQTPLSELNLFDAPMVLSDRENLPPCDLYIGSMFRDVQFLFQRGKGKIVHLCQGYEPADLASRINRKVLTERYLRKGILSFWRYFDQQKFKRKVKAIEAVYALPTIKAAVSLHLVKLIQTRYGQPCFLVQNGIDPKIFFPDEKKVWARNGKVRILSVGPLDVGIKGIPDTLDAIKILKKRGIPIHVIRVSPHPPSEREEVGRVVDEYHMNLNEKEMGELYRDVDLFISSSLEGEGFGLPAMEALASGVPSILTEISSYLFFDEHRDFAFFVPTHRPDRIAEGVMRLIEDETVREKIRRRGLEVARRFTLEETKQMLLSFIKEIQ